MRDEPGPYSEGGSGHPAEPSPRIHDREAQPRLWGQGLWRGLDRGLTRLALVVRRLLPDPVNPLLHTGALANWMLLLACATGVLLLFWYVPSHESAYTSVLAMEDAPLTAGLLRSLHRYTSDATLLLVLLHALQILGQRRVAGARWVAWVTGVVAVGLIWLVGWTGYWLVWDERGQLVAEGTAKLLDVVPIFTEPLAGSFLTDDTVSSLLFFVVFFVHMLLPMVMAIALWLHLARLARPVWLPGRALLVASALAVVGLSLLAPATSAAEAAMTARPTDLTMDWWYLLPLVLTDRLEGGALWAVTLGAALVFLSVPWWLVRRRTPRPPSLARPSGARPDADPDAPSDALSREASAPPSRRPPLAEVIPALCNACETCFKDCPFDAIAMVPRSDGRRFPSVAVVDPAKCVGCGICAGSCDSSGIGIEWLTQPAERRRVDAWLAASAPAPGPPRPTIRDPEASCEPPDLHRVDAVELARGELVAFVCASSAGEGLPYDPDTGACEALPGYRVVALPCAGWLHPLTVERALRRGASGVLVASCRPGTCGYREGAQWTADRLAGRREPELRRDRLDPARIRLLALDAPETVSLRAESAAFRAAVGNLDDPSTAASEPPSGEDRSGLAASPPRRAMVLGGAVVAAVLAFLVWLPSDRPYLAPASPGPELAVAFKLAGPVSESCVTRTPEELAALPPHKRVPEVCERRRADIRLRIDVDGEVVHDHVYPPQGVFGDGASNAVELVVVPEGERRVRVALGPEDPDRPSDAWRPEHVAEQALTFTPQRRRVVRFERHDGFMWY